MKTRTAQPHGKTDHLGHRRSYRPVLDCDARPSWFAYGMALGRPINELGVVNRRKKKRKR